MKNTVKVYCLANTKRRWWWVWAHSMDEAKQISLKARCVKKIENLKVVGGEWETEMWLHPTPGREKIINATNRVIEQGLVGIGKYDHTNNCWVIT